jgi:hypothetical protein
VVSAQALLVDNTPAQAAADLETLRRWAVAHPEILNPDEDRCARITAKLKEMAQRMEAQR